MTREEWINEILIPWKPGDVLEEYNRHTEKWSVVANCQYPGFDPMNATPQLNNDVIYRIRPRLEQWVIEIPAGGSSAFLRTTAHLVGNQVGLEDIGKAIRNAWKLNE